MSFHAGFVLGILPKVTTAIGLDKDGSHELTLIASALSSKVAGHIPSIHHWMRAPCPSLSGEIPEKLVESREGRRQILGLLLDPYPLAVPGSPSSHINHLVGHQ